MVSFGGLKLSKTYAREMIQKGVYKGWDDPRTWSLQSLDKRGIRPEALRTVLLSMGLKMADIDFPYNILYAENQKIIDPISNRYFFVEEPVTISISGIPKTEYTAEPLVNPLDISLGNRKITIAVTDGMKDVLISRADAGKIDIASDDVLLRLKDLFNITISPGETTATFHSKELDVARSQKAQVIHWVDSDEANNVTVEIMMPDGKILSGKGEASLAELHPGDMVQFERFGFTRIQSVGTSKVEAWFTH